MCDNEVVKLYDPEKDDAATCAAMLEKPVRHIAPGRLALVREAMDGLRGEDQLRIADVGLDWLNTLLRKNADYGSSAWRVPVLAPGMAAGAAILVRMSDKIERLSKLLDGNCQAQAAESIEDTITDLGAYCLLYLARPGKEGKDG